MKHWEESLRDDVNVDSSDWVKHYESVELPEWLMKELPVMRPKWWVKWANEEFVLEDHDGNIVDTSDNFAELYEKYKKKEEYTLTADDSCDGHGGSVYNGAFSEDFVEGKRTTRFYPLMDDETHLTLIKSTYKLWLDQFDKEWQANQDDWVLAFNWLTHHPAFWSRDRDEKTWHWNTSNGLSSLWVNVTKNNAGEPLVMFEHGAHVADHYTQHYHDYRLDVYSDNLHNAYIELAKLVHKFFNIDGTEREDVEYEKSETELLLEERLRDIEEESESEEVGETVTE